jgi:uncharacterized repeat protein (TIGR03803 family)
VLTKLHIFDGTDGFSPEAGLIQGTDGKFYGTTYYGGANGVCDHGCGTVFSITAGGVLTTLHSFDFTDGAGPFAGLIQGTNGKFYGTTQNGGASGNCTNGCGTVFSITADGTLTTLHSFDGTDGSYPYAGLIQGTNGKFYGTAYEGGANGDGTVFSITAGGTLTTLHSFDGADGQYPYAGLIQGTDGEFYGTTQLGGASGNCTDGCGTVFTVTAGGTLATLHSFDFTDGAESTAGLVQGTNGTFYGTAYEGGANNDGTVFSLSVGLGPFVETNPAAAKVAANVGILGTNLTGATTVTFNGTSAPNFEVQSNSLILAQVPTGATSGTVQVQLPGGTLSSNLPFIVLK